jgi:hypothetical protein
MEDTMKVLGEMIAYETKPNVCNHTYVDRDLWINRKVGKRAERGWRQERLWVEAQYMSGPPPDH